MAMCKLAVAVLAISLGARAESSVQKCLESKCVSTFGACKVAPTCTGVVTCMNGCGDDDTCATNCFDTQAKDHPGPLILALDTCGGYADPPCFRYGLTSVGCAGGRCDNSTRGIVV